MTPAEAIAAHGLATDQASVAPVPRVRPRSTAKPPPPEISAKPGVNSIFGIAEGHLNRLITPFATPVIKTTSPAATSIEQNIVYVAAQNDEPIGLYIYDATDPVSALSVTLVPADIPPVSVTLRLQGHASTVAGEKVYQTGDARLAQGWETEQPFVEALTSAFKAIALGQVPDGYSLESISSWPRASGRCLPAGLKAQPRQLVTGFNVNVVIARATNTTGRTLEVAFDERTCGDHAVLAATTWPLSTVPAYGSVELYIAYRRPADAPSDTVRPSVLGGGS